MHLPPALNTTYNPFTERTLQARLGRFWSTIRIGDVAGKNSPSSSTSSPYDPISSAEHYEKFCTEFLPKVPPSFALEPNTEWDQQVPQLPLQRKLFHISVFDSICHNFRQLLRLEPNEVRNLPSYKICLLRQHRRNLAAAAMGLLRSVSFVHASVDFNRRCLSLMIFHYFEGAVILCFCLLNASDGSMGEVEPNHYSWQKGIDVSPGQCFRAVDDVLGCLGRLATGSIVAETAARHLTKLVDKLRATNRAETTISASHPNSTVSSAITSVETLSNDTSQDLGFSIPPDWTTHHHGCNGNSLQFLEGRTDTSTGFSDSSLDLWQHSLSVMDSDMMDIFKDIDLFTPWDVCWFGTEEAPGIPVLDKPYSFDEPL